MSIRSRARTWHPSRSPRLLAALAFVLILEGCGPAEAVAAVPVGTSGSTIQLHGVPRSFRLYRPAALTTPAPLVVMLHGGFADARQAERAYGWDAEADRGHFLVAYPNGIRRAWNTGGGCCGRPAADNVDDVAFISAMVGEIGRRVPVDTHRVYATGISNGGVMAYTLACRTRLFAAIGPDSATQLGDCVDPAPISVIHLHGTADRRIPYAGGRGAGSAHIDGPSAPALNATWRATDRCAPPTVTTEGVLTTSVAACPGGRAVELVTIAGAGHQWPGSARRPLLQRILPIDPPSTALDATATIWRFFARHPAP